MGMLMMVAESILLIFGSLLAAVLICMLLWRVLALVKHPECGAVVIVAVAIITLAIPLTHSPFVRMMLLFSVAGAVPFWIAGRAWRSAAKGRMHAPVVDGAN